MPVSGSTNTRHSPHPISHIPHPTSHFPHLSKMNDEATWFTTTFSTIRTEVEKAIVGQQDIVEGVLVGLAANGPVLLEGMPGLGKTLLVRSLSQALSLDFSQIQFPPDMMPADVTGTNVLSQSDTGA